MAIRYMLLRNAMGLSTYTFHAREVAKTLIATGEGKTPFVITDHAKLKNFAGKAGLETEKPTNELAVDLGRFMLATINGDCQVPLTLIEPLSTPGRVAVWRKLGIIAGGQANEQIDAVSHCLTNVDGDYISLSKTALRLGISCIYGSLIPLEFGQDILFGTPRPHKMNLDLGILDPGYVNIVVNGHEPFIGIPLIMHCRAPAVQAAARALSAKGIRVIGSIETG